MKKVFQSLPEIKNATKEGKKKETKTKIYSSESDMRRFNLFITGGLGLEVFKIVQLKLGYSFGCISKATTFSMYDSHLKLGVAYLF